jgi:hypothetical protein
MEQLPAEQPRSEHDEAEQAPRKLTQRELVRASLLRIPPPQPAEQPNR